MAATLIPAEAGTATTHRLRLPPPEDAASALDEARYGLGNSAAQGPLSLEAHGWELNCDDLRQLTALLLQRGLKLVEVVSSRPTTLVAAAALGLESRWPTQPGEPGSADPSTTVGPDAGSRRQPAGERPPTLEPAGGLLIHQGTLRSGDHLQSDGSVLLLGDLNPGARISAGAHVLVWGKLRGVAHAGRNGDRDARIVALQLRPLQLRIADAVARGPEDTPPEGLAEEARLELGEIRIEPARPLWPLQ